jgi:hypothetical protein
MDKPNPHESPKADATPPDADVLEAIAYADSLLPGVPAPKGQRDDRWQAILHVENYVESNPEEVWQFVQRWGGSPQEDLRDAIACCLLEHLLEVHFQLVFPRVEAAVRENPAFADTWCRCWKLGQAAATGHSEAFDNLRAWCEEARRSRYDAL